MIKIKGTKDYLVALESVAMTDIVLNMFIFFFISFSLLYTLSPERMAKLEVRLPKASSALPAEGASGAVITITRDGEFYLDGKVESPAGLKDALKVAMGDKPSASVMVRVDAASRFDHVAKALDVVNELNISKVSVAVIKK